MGFKFQINLGQKNITFFEGEFHQGVREGPGTEYIIRADSPTINLYVKNGSYSEDKEDSYFEHHHSLGEIYCSYKNGMKHGPYKEIRKLARGLKRRIFS